jgi:hypothetical protein
MRRVQQGSLVYHNSEHDRWWFSDEISTMPSVVVPFFGAGLSVEPPACLPKGIELTVKLMDCLFDFSDREELIKVFQRASGCFGPASTKIGTLNIRRNTGNC